MTYVSTFARSQTRGEARSVAIVTAVATVSLLTGMNAMTLAAAAALVDRRFFWVFELPKPVVVLVALGFLLASYWRYGRRHDALMAAYLNVENVKSGVCWRRAISYAVVSTVSLVLVCWPLYGTGAPK